MNIGSLLWRNTNYGISATLKYIYTSKVNKNFFNYPAREIINTLTKFNYSLFKINEKDLLDLENSSNKTFDDISENLNQLVMAAAGDIKRNVTGDSASKTRLNVLAYIISYLDFDLIIETGTQHGISALFLEKF